MVEIERAGHLSDQPSSRVRWLIAAALVVQVVLALWAVDAADLVRDSDEIDSRPASVPPVSAPIGLESGQAVASAYAREWHADATLISAVMRLEWPTDSSASTSPSLPDGGWLIYVYAHGDSTLSIYLDRRSGGYIMAVPSDFGAPFWPAIDMTGVTRTSTTAFLTAEILGGTSYRQACPSTRSVALVSFTSATDDSGKQIPAWTVTYGDSRFPGTFDVLIQLNAQNGNVIKNEVSDRSCD